MAAIPYNRRVASDPQNWGFRAAAALRAARRVPHGRLASAALAGLQGAATTLGRVLHVLFLEVTGFVFACFTIIGSTAAVREYHRYAAGQIGPSRAIVAALFALVFGWFTASNFWRAARRRK